MRVESKVPRSSDEESRRWRDRGRSIRLDTLIPEPRVVGPVIAVAVVAMWLLVTTGRPWELFASGTFSSDFYDAQADAFLDGRLDVDPAVAQLEGVDMDGKIYLYYGVLLSIVRLPIVLATDSLAGQLARCSILIAYTVGLIAAAHMAQAVGRLVRPDGPVPAWRVGAFVAAVAVSPTLFAAGWITVYHETEIWAFAFAVIALAAAVRLIERPSMGAALVAAGGAALCTMTRASVGVGATAAVIVALVVAYGWRSRQLIGPAVLAVTGGLVHAWVNWARFGDPVNVPVDRQVANEFDQRRADWLARHGDSIFSSEFIPSTLWHYLRPDAIRLERLIPFVRYGPRADELGGIEFESNTPATSLTVSATLLVVLAIAGLIWLVRRQSWAPIVIAAAMALGTIPTFAIGFVANRYLIDLLPPLALLAAFGVWVNISRQRAIRPAVVALVAWGLLVNVSLALWTGTGHTVGFTQARYEADKMLPAPSPSLMELPPDGAERRMGTVAIDRPDDCKAVYVAGADAWVALERTQGYREVTGTFPTDRAVDLVDTGEWSLDVEPSGEIVYRSGPTEHVIATIDTASDDVDYKVVADPTTNERYVSTTGGFGFLPTEVLTSEQLDESAAEEPGSLCRLLVDRLD